MAAREKGGRVVFIGNIPYGVSEEQICELFGRCGPVVSFRLVYDKETGRPKGFGFLEYTNADAAAAAVRNLNEHDIMGRTLRVDYSNDNDKGGRTAGADGLALPVPGQPMAIADTGLLPALPAGIDVAPGLTAPDAISKTVTAIPPPQLLDILSQMKALVASDPQKATLLLSQAPQLGYALFQALLLLGLVKTDILASLIATTQNAAPQQPPQPQQQPLPQQQQAPPPPQALPPQGYPPQMPPGYQPVPQAYAQPGFAPQNYATPPPAAAYQPPPPVQQPAFAGLDPQIIETVRHLTREQIMGLDEASRNEIIRIRMAIGLPQVPY